MIKYSAEAKNMYFFPVFVELTHSVENIQLASNVRTNEPITTVLFRVIQVQITTLCRSQNTLRD